MSAESMIQALLVGVQAVSAVVIAILTYFYVDYTRKLLGEAEKQTKNAKKPVVVLRFRELRNERHHVYMIQDRLVNIGSGPALNIKLSSNARLNTDGNIEGWEVSNQLRPWSSSHPVDNVLGPDTGDSDLQICFIASSSKSCLKERQAYFEVTYDDIFGRSFKTVFKECKNTFIEMPMAHNELQSGLTSDS